MGSPGVYRGILAAAPRFCPSTSPTVTHVLNFDDRAHKLALRVAVKAPHGQGMEWAWMFWLPNLFGDFRASASMHSGIAPVVHAPGGGFGVTGVVDRFGCLLFKRAKMIITQTILGGA
jgi:hypothetical protein